jgi:hypothetical protein
MGGMARTPLPVATPPAAAAASSASTAYDAVGEAAPLPHLQAAMHYLATVNELLEWAPSGLVPKRVAVTDLKTRPPPR